MMQVGLITLTYEKTAALKYTEYETVSSCLSTLFSLYY